MSNGMVGPRIDYNAMADRIAALTAECKGAREISKELGISLADQNLIIRSTPDMGDRVNGAIKALALSERGRNLEKLIEIRNHAKPADALGAIDRIDARAGAVYQKQEDGSRSIVILGETVNVGAMTADELDG